MIYRWFPVAAWVGLLLVLSLLPATVVETPAVLGFDKLAHAAVYGVLALLAHRAVRRPCLSCGLVVAVLCGALGACLELAQAFVPGRTPSLADAVANLAGAAIASAVYVRCWAGTCGSPAA